MKRKIRRKENEATIHMDFFAAHRERKVWFTEMFLEDAKDMSSEAFRIYMEVLNNTKGYEIIIVK